MSKSMHRQIAAYEKGAGADVQGLINDHVGLVRKIAWQVQAKAGAAIEAEDLIQIGILSLIEAAHGYEDRGIPFAHYVKIRAKGAMIDHYRKISIASRTTLARRKQFVDAYRKLEAIYGRVPSDTEIAGEIGIAPAAVRHIEVELGGWRISSLDEAYSETSMEFAADIPLQDESFDRNTLEERLAEAIAELPQRETMILQLIYFEEMNLEEVGATLNVTAARVCQIKKAALSKIRERLGDHCPF